MAKTDKKTAASSDDSSDSDSLTSGESSSEESDTLKRAKVALDKGKKTSDSEEASTSEESSSDESDTRRPAKVFPDKGKLLGKKTSDSEDSTTSGESSSEESDTSKQAKVSPDKGKKISNSDDASTSGESSSEESDSDEEDVKASAPPRTAPAEINKKRRADSESASVPKKVKLANDSANAVTTAQETKSIFVGRLSWNVDNDWLAQEFAECGEIESAYVQMDRNTGRSRGFGYVHFKTADAVEKALGLNGKEIDGRAVSIDKSNSADKKASIEKRAQFFGDVPSPPSTVLFVGNLSFGVNEDMLWETFGEHGDVKSVRVPTDRDTGRPKGFAYVEFSEMGAAKRAHGALQGFELDGRSLRLDFSQPRDSAGGRGGGQGGRGGRGGRGRGGFGSDRRGASYGGRGGDRGGRGRGRGRGRGARTGGITQFEGQKITFD